MRAGGVGLAGKGRRARPCLRALFVWLAAALICPQPLSSQPSSELVQRSAAPCDAQGLPVVEWFAAAAMPRALSLVAVAEQLQAALRARRLQLCVGPLSDSQRLASPPLAQVRVGVHGARAGESGLVAELEVVDAVTHKSLRRRLPLTSIPADGRPLSVAAAADELLRASWAELSLRDAAATEGAPEAVRRSLPKAPAAPVITAPPARPRWELQLAATALVLQKMQAYGGRLRMLHHLSNFQGIAGGALVAFGPSSEGEHGHVRPSLFGGEIGVLHGLQPLTSSLGVAAEAAVGVNRVGFKASSKSSGVAASFVDWSMAAHLRLHGWYSVEALRAFLAVGYRHTIRTAVAGDAGIDLVADRGPGFELICGGRALF